MFNAITIMKCSREFAGDLLAKTFETIGQTPSVETVTALYKFVVENFGRDDSSDVAKRYWVPVAYYLASNGISKPELAKLRRPYPIHTEPGFRSVLDELYDEGHDVPEQYLSPTTKRRMEKQS